uniref:Uncharacterized protein n=1 Tax=Chromera velia CCMP2878 TaxID=1169474 RepID=A0A0G4I0Y7_9ALVE|eukprot:Cvel_10070.t1-p1 / transcript=Cvel_10070.t1 / gene=Cvel_10070 / organism=Chromera_velia_CCMP2878 / gene_product=hypothetical protein / transcript_product=hypothetical protein / location=Cvel_scaffold599:40899-41243(+) / protein_length=115 / sequence_SO=supercontig / SO=protein_coding / is_pseudo=false
MGHYIGTMTGEIDAPWSSKPADHLAMTSETGRRLEDLVLQSKSLSASAIESAKTMHSNLSRSCSDAEIKANLAQFMIQKFGVEGDFGAVTVEDLTRAFAVLVRSQTDGEESENAS